MAAKSVMILTPPNALLASMDSTKNQTILARAPLVHLTGRALSASAARPVNSTVRSLRDVLIVLIAARLAQTHLLARFATCPTLWTTVSAYAQATLTTIKTVSCVILALITSMEMNARLALTTVMRAKPHLAIALLVLAPFRFRMMAHALVI
jgi:hypothetical protein